MLLNCHGEDVLRVKGMLNVRGVSAPVLINAVQHVVHPPVHLEAWPERHGERASLEDDVRALIREQSERRPGWQGA